MRRIKPTPKPTQNISRLSILDCREDSRTRTLATSWRVKGRYQRNAWQWVCLFNPGALVNIPKAGGNQTQKLYLLNLCDDYHRFVMTCYDHLRWKHTQRHAVKIISQHFLAYFVCSVPKENASFARCPQLQTILRTCYMHSAYQKLIKETREITAGLDVSQHEVDVHSKSWKLRDF